MIATLPLLTPDPWRSDQTIAKCHERLAKRRQRRMMSARPDTMYLAVERALVGGLCVIYISSVALVAIRMLSESL
jgi:hypothetical protein